MITVIGFSAGDEAEAVDVTATTDRTSGCPRSGLGSPAATFALAQAARTASNHANSNPRNTGFRIAVSPVNAAYFMQ
ncbi:MAG: hypothetical protein ABI854_06040 [Betaproteobacteria bacterium]